MKGTTTAELRQCPGCEGWTRWLSMTGRCRDCMLGWHPCPTNQHGGWEHGPPADHNRVTVRMVLHTIPIHSEIEAIR